MARRTPELNLTPELPEVVSSDFNLFFRPQVAPQDESVQLLTKAMDNFVNDAGTKLVISSERKLKKEEIGKAKQDYLENKKKFRDAVKDGTIDKTANPYYIEEYKRLTLNDYASKFIDRFTKEYKSNGIVKDLREGAFNDFYKSQLEAYIKENNLGQFEATELENGFFKETSSFRAILENNHRQAQLKEFDKNFNEKVENRIYGILEKFKDFENSPLGDFDDGISKYKFLGQKIQDEIGKLVDVGDGDVTDRILQGLEKFVVTTRDYEYAKQIISNLPQFIEGGTGKFGDIGKVKMKQEELMTLLIQNQELKESNDIKLRETQDKKEFVSTYDFLVENADDPTFNITEFRNSADRTISETKAVDTFIKDQQFDGGNSDNPQAVNDIFKLLDDDEYEKAEQLARTLFRNGDIRKSTYNSLITSDIPNHRNFKNKPVFSNEVYQNTISGLNSVLSSSAKYGDKLQAGIAKSYIQKKMLRWYKENRTQKKYTGDNGEFLSEEFENAFVNQFNNIVEVMKVAKKPTGEALFPALQFDQTSSFGEVEGILDKDLKKLINK